ncbi:universal stress protein [Arsenicicoccus piscis]|uniref:universal stress protein n=1 Tax=Arsenicicoccus piscis TaxID=673954 RepID=UPI001F4C60B6|nr:universal stress protein [Arsenicicoccus piscis]MCH8626756.1 universal stress protein [Arsenicicoccus piscis]
MAEEPVIVVGVSPRAGSPFALQWAMAQADRIGGRVVALRACKTAPANASTRPGVSPLAHDESAVANEALADLERSVVAILGTDHGVELKAVEGGRRSVLVEASKGVDLLVVDAPRSVNPSSDAVFARRLLDRAHCPVVVMPPTISGEPPTWLAHTARVLGDNVLRSAGTAGRPGLPPLQP